LYTNQLTHIPYENNHGFKGQENKLNAVENVCTAEYSLNRVYACICHHWYLIIVVSHLMTLFRYSQLQEQLTMLEKQLHELEQYQQYRDHTKEVLLCAHTYMYVKWIFENLTFWHSDRSDIIILIS